MRHTVRDDPWDEPEWRWVLDRERNGRRRPNMPIYMYHVAGDELVPTAVGRELLNDYTALGADVTWTDVRADDHLAGAFIGAADVVRWLAEQLDQSAVAPSQSTSIAP